MPHVDRIAIFPVKALDGFNVDQARIVSTGSLEHDREFAIVQEDGTRVNGKRRPEVHQIRSRYEVSSDRIILHAGIQGAERSFRLGDQNDELEDWLSEFFGFAVKITRDRGGLPDTPAFHGPSIISTGTLEKVSNWFEGITVTDARARFRANIEVGGVPAFWEDRYAGLPDAYREFHVGNVRFQAARSCTRCPVPSHDPLTGETYPEFQKIFVANREESLPDWTDRAIFEHFYRISLLTIVPASEEGKSLRIGDVIE